MAMLPAGVVEVTEGIGRVKSVAIVIFAEKKSG